jgi:hypothetical protein
MIKRFSSFLSKKRTTQNSSSKKRTTQHSSPNKNLDFNFLIVYITFFRGNLTKFSETILGQNTNLSKIKQNILQQFGETVDDKTVKIVSIFSALSFNNELLQSLIVNTINDQDNLNITKDDLQTVLALILELHDIEELPSKKTKGGANMIHIFKTLQIIFLAFMTSFLFYYSYNATNDGLKEFYNSKTYLVGQQLLPILQNIKNIDSCSPNTENPFFLNINKYAEHLTFVLPKNFKEVKPVFDLLSKNLNCLFQSPSVKSEFDKMMAEQTMEERLNSNALVVLPNSSLSSIITNKAYEMVLTTQNKEYIDTTEKALEQSKKNFNAYLDKELAINNDKRSLIKFLSEQSTEDIYNILIQNNPDVSYTEYFTGLALSFMGNTMKNPAFSPIQKFATEIHNFCLETNKDILTNKIILETKLSQIKNEISLFQSQIFWGTRAWWLTYICSASLVGLIFSSIPGRRNTRKPSLLLIKSGTRKRQHKKNTKSFKKSFSVK